MTVLHDGIAGVDVRAGDSERAIAEMRDAGGVMMKAVSAAVASKALLRFMETSPGWCAWPLG